MTGDTGDTGDSLNLPGKKIGRPSSYSDGIASEICDRMVEGESLLRICKDEHIPARVTIYRWLESNSSFRDKYARAREAAMDYYTDLIRDIAFDDSGDFFIEDGKTVADHARVQRARLKVDALKWTASKLAPRQYGDRPELPAADAGKLEISWQRIETVIIDSPPKLIAHDPGPLPKRIDPEILVRLVEMIKQRVPRADQRSPDAVLDEVMGVIDRALLLEYGDVAEGVT